MRSPYGWGKPSTKGSVYYNFADRSIWIKKMGSRWVLLQAKDGYKILGNFNSMTEAAAYYKGEMK
jgi:hypothetical protein